jgi:hypothetical protein
LFIGLAERWLYADGPAGTERLINSLCYRWNRVKVEFHCIPGGERLSVSRPMKSLVARGNEVLPALHNRLADRRVQNEVALILGSIGDETSVPLLIDYFPTDVPEIVEGSIYDLDPDSVRLKYFCFTHALIELTGTRIGHSRWGSDCDPGNRARWQEWWAIHKKIFVLGGVMPKGTVYHNQHRPAPPIDVVIPR